jgi:hypothetical protein
MANIRRLPSVFRPVLIKAMPGIVATGHEFVNPVFAADAPDFILSVGNDVMDNCEAYEAGSAGY